jgi:hypothetical protein
LSWPARADEAVLDSVYLEQRAEGAVVPVDEGVVGEQPPRFVVELGEVRQGPLDEADGRLGALIAVQLALA